MSNHDVNGGRYVADAEIIAAKVPQEITHKKCLLECEEEFGQFIETMSLLGDRLGPLLLQSPCFNTERAQCSFFPARSLFHAATRGTLREMRFDHNGLQLHSLAGRPQGIEKITNIWDRIIIDRTGELQEWVTSCQRIQKGGVTIYAYANNHYAGHGPATVEQFRELCRERGIEIPNGVQLPMKLAAGTLFDIP